MLRFSHHRLGGLLALIGSAIGCELPPSPEQNESAPRVSETRASLTAETNAVHLLGIDRSRRLRHTIRHENGAWDALGDVATQAGELGRFTNVTSAYSDSLLFVAARTDSPRWWLTVRFDHGPWSTFSSLGDNSGTMTDMGMDRTSDGNIHLCGHGSRLFHGIWTPSTGFGGFNELPIQRPANAVTAVDCAAVGGDLYYVVVTTGGPGRPMQHRLDMAVRRSDGSWSNFETTHLVDLGEDFVGSVSLDSSGDRLHVQVTTRSRQYHSTKAGSGPWAPLERVEIEAGDPGTPSEPFVDSGATAAVGSDLHLVQATQGASSGRVMHTIRFSSGGWAAFANVGSAVPGGIPSGGLSQVSLSRSRNN